jgi:hypothetical protein
LFLFLIPHFLRGSLPWQGLNAKSRGEKEKLILERKQSAIDSGLFEEDVPNELMNYFKHVCSLRSDEAPNYSYLRRLFRNLFHRKRFEYDNVFDWTMLKFLEKMAVAQTKSS